MEGFESIQKQVVSCERCGRLRAHCRHIATVKKREFLHWDYWGKPIPAIGDSNGRLMIVGLAPAAHGANRTGRMFTGDSSGDWLYDALYRYGFANQAHSVSRDDGLTLHDCYITASARCAPPDNKPTSEELANCAPFLMAEWNLSHHVEVVIVLGGIARERWLRATGWWDALLPADRPQFGHGKETVMPDGVTFLCSYHPSRQNTNTGRLTRDMWYGIFARARQLLGSQRV